MKKCNICKYRNGLASLGTFPDNAELVYCNKSGRSHFVYEKIIDFMMEKNDCEHFEQDGLKPLDRIVERINAASK